MAQITITGRVTDYQKTPYVDFPVTNGRDTVRTDSEGRYKIEAKLWDVIYFYRFEKKSQIYYIIGKTKCSKSQNEKYIF